MTRNHLWELIQSYMDDPKHRYPPKPADLARETGVSEQVLSKWKAKPVMPNPVQLGRFAAGTRLSYADLLKAALRGRGYLPSDPSFSTVELSGDFVRLFGIDGEDSVLDMTRHKDGKRLLDGPFWFDEDGNPLPDEEQARHLLPSVSGYMSLPPDTPSDLVAADEQERSISGEQVEPETS